MEGSELSQVRFTVEEINELKSIIKYARNTGDFGFVSNPIQFKIYRKLFGNTTVCCNQVLNLDELETINEGKSLYDTDYSELKICPHQASWMTEPHSKKNKKILKKLADSVDKYNIFSVQETIEKYFGKEMSDIVNQTFWCSLHVGKLKEIAVKI